ncbi:MAG: hypothetical protein HQL98_03090 [Magnetococcales bacterium]|nr:hypothetical protein [Magnetococcales bacterium]
MELLHRITQQKGRVRVSKRIPGHGHGYGVLVIGEARHQVEMVDMGLRGMSVVSPVCLPEDHEVVMEVSEAYGVDAYRCRVVFCRDGEWGWQTGLEIVERDPGLLVIHIP